MPNIWFTSDCHFSHNRIIQYCNRPFQTIEEMDSTLISNINRLVKKNDTLWYLGDFVWYGSRNIQRYRQQINCRRFHLILGNHDGKIRKRPQDFSCFESIDEIKDIKIGDKNIVLCHYSMRVWNKKHYGALHLYGHSHGTLEKYQQSMDVGVDTNSFYPYNFDEIVHNITD